MHMDIDTCVRGHPVLRDAWTDIRLHTFTQIYLMIRSNGLTLVCVDSLYLTSVSVLSQPRLLKNMCVY